MFTIQDDYANPQEPTEAMTFSQYGMTGFEVQYWTGAPWQTVPGGSVSGNNRVWRKFTFAPVSTSSIRVLVTGAPDSYSRLAEVEAYEVADSPPATPGPINVAAQANGGVAFASSTAAPHYPVTAVNDGNRLGSGWGQGGGWADGTPGTWPDVVQVNFAATRSITEINLFSIQDNYPSPQNPTPAMTFSLYGLIDFDLQYWDGSTWAFVPGGSVNGNDKVWRKFSFPAIATASIRVVVRRASDAFSRIAEIEAIASP